MRKHGGTTTSSKLQNRLASTFAVGAFLSSALLFSLLFLVARAQMREDIRLRLADAVGIAALMIDGDAHAALTERAHEATDTYRELKRTLQEIRDSGTDIRFVYTMRRADDGGIEFVVDAETDEAEIAHLGDVYTDASPALRARFDEMTAPVVEEGFYTDRWGTWLTGYAPFRRGDGAVEGIVGMDIAASKVVAKERELFAWMLVSLAAVVLVLLLMGIVVGRRIAGPIVKLKAVADRIAGGDLEKEAEASGGDEIGELARAFNTMTRRLKESLDRLKAEAEERAQAERTMRISKESYRTLYDDNPSMYFTVDTAGVALSVNDFGAAQLGYTVEELEGRLMSDLYHDDDRAAFCGWLARCIEAPSEVRRWELRKIKRDGSVIWVKETARAIHREDGVVVVLVVCEDISRKKAMEEEVLQSAKLASVGRLAAGVAHEINNPLSAITQSAQVLSRALRIEQPRTAALLEERNISPAAFQDYLERRKALMFVDAITESVRRAAGIVSDLLDFARVSKEEATAVDMNDLLRHTIDLAAADWDLKKKYDFKKIRLDWELAEDLPRVTCHGQQIQQVVLNLVRNAAQAMSAAVPERAPRPAEPRLILRTMPLRKDGGAAADASWVRLEIEDNGPGIPQEVLFKLFEPFFTTKGKEGTGLGLWLCWSIVVERHRGRLWVESGAMGGSRFLVELPVRFGGGREGGRPAAADA